MSLILTYFDMLRKSWDMKRGTRGGRGGARGLCGDTAIFGAGESEEKRALLVVVVPALRVLRGTEKDVGRGPERQETGGTLCLTLLVSAPRAASPGKSRCSPRGDERALSHRQEAPSGR